MCRIVQCSGLDKVARDFVDSFGGYGIVMDEDCEYTPKEEEVVEIPIVITRNPKPVREKGMWT